MARPVRRELLWGTMAWRGRRRTYVFRVDPDGLVAIRVGSPLSWTAFFAIVVGVFIATNASLGLASVILGSALGFAILGLLERALTRALASQPKDRLLQSNMNLFLPREAWGGSSFEESGPRTFFSVNVEGGIARIAVRRPEPPHARRALDLFLQNND